jgi:isoleucyl-tRNA synthetase
LAKTGELVSSVEANMNRYDSYSAAANLRDFADILTNWYVRRSRDRFWVDSPEAFDTLYTVLETVCRVAAPLLPMVTEEIWQGLTGGRSVHLEFWPDASLFPRDQVLVRAMDQVRSVASVSLSLRKAAGLRVRLPLNKLTVVLEGSKDLSEFASIIADELNVKKVELVELSLDSTKDFGVVKQLTVNSRVAGPRLGKDVQQVIGAAKSGNWTEVDGVVTVGGVELIEGEYDLSLVADVTDTSDQIAILPGGGFVILDGNVTPELEVEGAARDLIRQVQQARKDADLDVSDRIKLTIAGDAALLSATETHRDLVMSETLAVELELINGESSITVVRV